MLIQHLEANGVASVITRSSYYTSLFPITVLQRSLNGVEFYHSVYVFTV